MKIEASFVRSAPSAADLPRDALAEVAIPGPRLWEPASPHLYVARATLRPVDGDGAPLDTVEERFGLRTVEVRDGKLLLNGRYDEGIQHRTRGVYLYDALAEPKRLVEVEGGHLPLFERWVPHARAWFDETLGPPARESTAR